MRSREKKKKKLFESLKDTNTCCKKYFCFFFACLVVFLTSSFQFFSFFQRVLYYFIGKIFSRRTEAVAWRCSGGVHLYQNLLFQLSCRIEAWNFIKTRLRHRCFRVTFAKVLRTPILQNMFERRGYLRENICHMKLLANVYLTK